jgi:hypothetical protein
LKGIDFILMGVRVKKLVAFSLLFVFFIPSFTPASLSASNNSADWQAIPDDATLPLDMNYVRLLFTDGYITEENPTQDSRWYNGEVYLGNLNTWVPKEGSNHMMKCENLLYNNEPNPDPQYGGPLGEYETVGVWRSMPLHKDLTINGDFWGRIWVYGMGVDVGYLFMIHKQSPGEITSSRFLELETETRTIEMYYQAYEEMKTVENIQIKKGDELWIGLGYRGRHDTDINVVFGNQMRDAMLTFPCDSIDITTDVKVNTADKKCTVTADVIDAFSIWDVTNATLKITQGDEVFLQKTITRGDIASLSPLNSSSFRYTHVWDYGDTDVGGNFTVVMEVNDNSTNTWTSEAEFYVKPPFGLRPGQAALLFVLALGMGIVLFWTYRAMKYRFKIEEIFLIYNTGVLISYSSMQKKEGLGDEEIVGGMLTAVQNYVTHSLEESMKEESVAFHDALQQYFKVAQKESGKEKKQMGQMLSAVDDFVKDSFVAEGEQVDEGLDKLEYGDMQILIERGNYVFLAVVISGYEQDYLRKEMRRVIERIETRYADVISKWDGDMAGLMGINDYLNEIYAVRRLRLPWKEN